MKRHTATMTVTQALFSLFGDATVSPCGGSCWAEIPAKSACVAVWRLTRRQGENGIREDTPLNQETVERLANLRNARRCGARTRAGTSCQCPAVRSRSRCLIHGSLSPGAPGGERNGFWTEAAGIAWLHPRCWQAWQTGRTAEAVASLTKMGITVSRTNR